MTIYSTIPTKLKKKLLYRVFDINIKKFGHFLNYIRSEYKITVNKNGIPKDPQSPFVTSGIRVGTPAMTRRGFKEHDFKDLGLLIAKFIKSMAANSLGLDVETENFVKAEVSRLTQCLNFYKSEVNLSQKSQ